MLMKPKKLRKIIRKEIGGFDSSPFYGLLLIVFANSWLIHAYNGTLPMANLFGFVTLLIFSGFIAKFRFNRWEK